MGRLTSISGILLKQHPRLAFPVLLILGSMLSHVEANTGTWATLPMTVMSYLAVATYRPSTVPVLVGTPPQQINLTVDVSTDILMTYGADCILCAGTTLFESSLSSSFKTNNTPRRSPLYSGVVASDNVGFGGLLGVQNQFFVNVLDGSNLTLEIFFWNGVLGLSLDPLNTNTSIAQHFLTQLYESSSILNPVVGMRFDPANPKITIGALDPNDYEGTINWVPINQSPDPGYANTFTFDGVKGYDGNFVPFGPNLTAELDSSSLSIFVPDAITYFNNTNSTGPVQDIVYTDDDGLDIFQYDCSNATKIPPETPYVALTVTINGVDYPIDSTGNLLRARGPDSAAGGIYCPVGIMSNTGNAQLSTTLGLPFMRSVYVAYRFPTGDCPGYYGFAFPSGANRTHSQISQEPTSTPTNSAKCLSLIAPTATPTANVVLVQEVLASKGTYRVFGRETATPVPLVGVDDLSQIVWDYSALVG